MPEIYGRHSQHTNLLKHHHAQHIKELSDRHSHQINMLSGSLLDKMMLFALPLAASSILQQLFNSADVAVVGRFAGSQAMAAVGSNGSLINLLINLFIGLSVGANVVIANYIGSGEEKKVQEVVHTAITLALVSGIFLLLLGIAVARPLLLLMESPHDVIDLAVVYLRIYFLGMPFIMLYNFGAAVLRSTGDTKRPMYCLVLSGMINVCLNLLLVIVFRLGVAGVGIATVVSNGVSAGLVLYFLLHEEETIRLHPGQLAIHKEHLRSIVRIGAPAGIQGMVFSLSNVCIQTAINGFGSSAVAGSAAALNFEQFAYFVINAFAQTTVTFTSQNYGAKQYERCRKIYRLCMVSGIGFCALLCAVFLAGRGVFIQFYTVEPEVIEYAMIRMSHVLVLEFLTGTYEISGAALRGIGCSMLPSCLTLLGSCGFRLLWIYTVFRNSNNFGMLMSVYPLTWIITGTAVITAYLIVRKKKFMCGEQQRA